MTTTDTSGSTGTGSGSDAGSAATQNEGGATTRRKLNDQQEREVTRLYSETETPVSEISKRFGIGESSVYRVAQRHGAKLRGRQTGGSGTTTTTTRAAGRAAAATAGG